MSDAEQFDVFYADARDRLLVQAFALTGDLPASRGAVRDSFIAAWHRWPKLRRLDDPESWVRPHVLTHAQRRHTARIFHRDRRLDPELRATLDALHKLSLVSRKALVLADLAAASEQERAREIGLPLDDAERRLLEARVQFVDHREVPATEIRPTLQRLAEHCADQRWPRATIIRRAGAARRRTHALAGAVLVTATLVVSGFVVADTHGVRPTLESARDRIMSVPGRVRPDPRPSADAVTTEALLTKAQVSRAVPGPDLAGHRHRPRAAQHAAVPAPEVRRPEGDHGTGAQLHHAAREGQAAARGRPDHGVLARRRRRDPRLRHDDRLVRRVHDAPDPAPRRTHGGPARRRGPAVRTAGVAPTRA